MALPIAQHSRAAMFAGAEEYDLVALRGEWHRFEVGTQMAVIAERLMLT